MEDGRGGRRRGQLRLVTEPVHTLAIARPEDLVAVPALPLAAPDPAVGTARARVGPVTEGVR